MKLNTTFSKPIILMFVTAIVFSGCETKFEETIDITDDAFMDALIRESVTMDRILTVEEAEAVSNLDLFPVYLNSGFYPSLDAATMIENLDGIEYFINLESLSVNRNLLTKIDLSNNTKLKSLECAANQITSLDLSANPRLNRLYCYGNEISSLEISCCTLLFDLICGRNNLSSLDISNNKSLKYIDIRDLPSLTEVCVWTLPFPPEGVYVRTNSSTKVDFITDCGK